jgi:hypothetical protein
MIGKQMKMANNILHFTKYKGLSGNNVCQAGIFQNHAFSAPFRPVFLPLVGNKNV